MVRKINNYLLLAILLLILGCTTTRSISPKDGYSLEILVRDSPVFSRSFTGFALYDPEAGQMVHAYQSEKYFTPASNTKIFTFFTALQVLGDRLPVLHYGIAGDTLIFWGTGNPLLLHPDFEQSWFVLEPLRRFQGDIFFSDHNYRDDRFGAGWSWDDYAYRYQAEKASLPLYGNMVHLKKEGRADSLHIEPGTFAPYFQLSTEKNLLFREEFANTFYYHRDLLEREEVDREIPFDYSAEWAARLLSDNLGRPVTHWTGPLPATLDSITLHLPTTDTLYRRLMQDSDNFIAEQLMLMVSDKLFGYQHTGDAIAYARDSLLSDLPDEPQWVDGSGLSRYNLFTPRTMVALLHKLYQEVPREELLSIFPAGGVSGTIQSWYKGDDGPYVFAKTGTLRNNHCLSGFLKTGRGKYLIFSFMHNNYTTSSAPLKEEMERVLEWIREHY